MNDTVTVTLTVSSNAAESGTVAGDSIVGTDGNDTLIGGGSNDTLSGGAGDDVLDDSIGFNLLQGGDGNDWLRGHGTFVGGAGNDTLTASGAFYENSGDTYVFNLGDGADTIVEHGTADTDQHADSADTVQFGPGILATDISRSRAGDDFVLSIGVNGTDRLTIQNWFAGNTSRIEQFLFADGTIWTIADLLAMPLVVTGTAGNDVLSGSDGVDDLGGLAGNDTLYASEGDDTLSGGAGDDHLTDGLGNNLLQGGDGNDWLQGHGTLAGGTGNDTLVASDTFFANSGDTYLFNLGDGADTIIEWGTADTDLHAASADVVHFGTGILPADITRARRGDDLVLSMGANGTDQLTIQGWFSDHAKRVEQFIFADETVWTIADLLGMPLNLAGTAGNDALPGSDGLDNIEGLAGNDTLYASQGDDTLDGGDGDDTLYDGLGFNVLKGGAGNDWLQGHGTFSGGTGNDTLVASDTFFENSGDTYLFNLGDGADTIIEWGTAETALHLNSTDVVRFGAGILPAGITRLRVGNDLVFSIGVGGTDQLTIQGWFSDTAKRIEQFIFSNETVWSAADLLDMPLIVTGSAGDDTLPGSDGLDLMEGLAGNDTLYSSPGDDTLSGGAGDDVLHDSQGNNLLQGGAGNDWLQGHGTFSGGTGNDTLVAHDTFFENSGDTYLFNLGDGADTIVEWGTADTSQHASSTDVVRFGAGILTDNVTQSRRGDDLVLTFGTTGATNPDQLTVQGWFSDTARRVEQFVFSDGTVWTNADLLGKPLNVTGTTGNDVLPGSDGRDRLEGLAGNDTLNASQGDDTLDGGDGDDTLYDGFGFNVLKGGAGNDWLQGHGTFSGGTGNDTLVASDTFFENSGDTYLFNLGDGADTIVEWGTTDNYPVSDDIVRFGPGIAALDTTLARNGNDLVLSIGPDQLTIQGWFADATRRIEQFIFSDGSVWSIADILGMPLNLTGTAGNDVLSGSDGLDKLDGLAGNDTLNASLGDDTLSGGAGDDVIQDGLGFNLLQGGDGNDWIQGHGTFSGGAGNDTLVASDTYYDFSGDTYLYGLGDGADTIIEWGTPDNYPSSADVVRFGPGILAADVNRTRQEDDLVLFFGASVNGPDRLTIQGWFADAAKRIEQFIFSDGTVWSTTDLLDMPLNVTGTAGNDLMLGSDGLDNLSGLAGDDTLSASAGDDTLSGGAGDDVLHDDSGFNLLQGGDGNDWVQGHGSFHGGAGNDTLVASGTFFENSGDTYLFNLGDGADTIIEYGTADTTQHASSADVVRFGPGILPADVIRSRSGDDLVLSISPGLSLGIGGTDRLTIQGWFTSDTYRIEQFVFANGTVWTIADLLGMPLSVTGTAGDDLILGSDGLDNLSGLAGNDTIAGSSGDDTLSGGAGDDVLEDGEGFNLLQGGDGDDWLRGHGTFSGGAGNDTLVASDTFLENSGDIYLFNLGDGADTIIEYGTPDTDQHAASTDIVRFGPGILPASVTRLRSDDDLVLSIGVDGTDQLTIQGWFADATSGIEQFIFSDGTVWTIADLLDMPFNVTGTAGDDVLLGSDGIDILSGLAGNDTLSASLGDDTLSGGAGDDALYDGLGSNVLQGGAGNDWVQGHGTLSGGTGNDTLVASDTFYEHSGDTYLFNLGDGADTIIEYGTPDTEQHTASADTVRFGTGILPAHLSRSRSGDDLVLSFSVSSTDQLTLQGWFADTASHVEQFMFADGTVWTIADLEQLDLLNNGTSGNDLLIGWNSADRLNGLAGDDTIYGLQGNDWLDGGSGTDWMEGGSGDDTYVVDNALDIVTEYDGEGTDTLQSSLTWTLGANLENLTLTGSAALSGFGNSLDNLLLGNSARNRLEGLAGNDTLDGGSGIDTLVGGSGDDTYLVESTGDRVIERSAADGTDTVLSSASYFTLEAHVENLVLLGSASIGGAGNALANVLTGNAGDNLFDGGEGSDTLFGGAGNDSLYGNAGSDSLVGGTGDDTYRVGLSTDIVVELADEGSDTVEAVNTSYTLSDHVENLVLSGAAYYINATGNALANHITGNWGYNVLTGGAGNDTLDGGEGADTAVGGTGDDTYYVNSSADIITELAGEGTDVVFSTARNFIMGANVEHITLQGSGSISAVGNASANTMIGNSGDNTLDGGEGNDSLVGGAGFDSLLGGAGSDTMAGGADSDFYRVGSAGDVVIELANEGLNDTVEAWIHYTLGANVEHLTLGSTNALNGTGNALNNVLTGNAANNVLDGLTGADTMAGGAGNDTYFVDNTADVVNEAAGAGTDQVNASVSYTLKANVERLTLTGSANLNGYGGDDANTLTGNSGHNLLDGGAGNDTLIGGAGNDTLLGNAGDDSMLGGSGNDTYRVASVGDTVVELAGEGTDSVEAYLSYTLGANVENVALFGSALTATGNALANQITGNSLANTLTGAAGNDTYVMGRGSNADTIVDTDASAGNLDTLRFTAGIASDQLWFRALGNDLEVSIIGTSDKATVKDWYLGSQHHLEQFTTADGKVLLDSAVDNLVTAMASFSPPAVGQTSLSSTYQASLATVIAANWS
ncbi:calcium-binding protein [Sphaerotilus sp.]|uniref:calcium-binding protein n=1 Tax=Sphaerotilus sp. TaxID=2093942 RepID=UPI002ACD7A1F|nr:calcium-binding protein [Sphaerotilus sp.]MDZ7855404.1 calcium-binding protein [Sphaerotilus sp.]